MVKNKLAKNIIIGCAVGDALGVPFEFLHRDTFHCVDMVGYGTHNQPKGAWSDDTSMLLCLAKQIAEGFSISKLANKFVDWFTKGEYTANGYVFDFGGTTAKAITKIKKGVKPVDAGGKNIFDNGNGSLMRIAPLVLLLYKYDVKCKYKICKAVSSITHGHEISIAACVIFIEFILELISGVNKHTAYNNTINKIKNDYKNYISEDVLNEFRLDVQTLDREEIKSSGYVIDTLEASIWSFLNGNSYEECVLNAVNLGDDTDTVGAITGVLAGVYYGYETIPTKWVMSLQNKQLLFDICNMF